MKRVIALLVLSVFLISSFSFAAGFDRWSEYNCTWVNDEANLEKGYYQDTEYHILMKSSKSWVPMDHQAKGAWITNHWTWYVDEYLNDSWQTALPYDTGAYRVEEFIKMVAIDDEDVEMYLDEGHFVIWGNILVLLDEVKIYNVVTGDLVDQFYTAADNNWGMKIDGTAYDLIQGFGYWQK